MRTFPTSTSDSKRASETSGSKCTKSSVIERLVSEKANVTTDNVIITDNVTAADNVITLSPIVQ